MKGYFSQILGVVYKLLILLLLFTICRLIFFIGNYQQFSQIGLAELLKIFVIGIRFDASALIEINLLFFFIYALPFRFVRNKKFLVYVNVLFYVVNALVLLLNFGDVEYFKYTGKRSTADLFEYLFISDDTLVLLPQFLKDFWYILLGWILTVAFGIFMLHKKPFQGSVTPIKGWRTYIVVVVLFFMLFGSFIVVARGLGLKPIRIISAMRYTRSQNIPLLLNTPFCIIHTLEEEEEAFRKYYSATELVKQYNPEQQISSGSIKRDNVVIIILESFSYEFIGSLTGGKSYTPNLDTIIHNGLVFENAFANGKRSIEALPAIFAGLPALTDNAYISSRYASNALEAMPMVLSKLGYHTSFFHGGRNGTMGFDDFSNIAGIEKYYGMNEYDGPAAFDGNWGIYDEEFLNFYAKKLNSFRQPFMSGVFTLSSHHPYSIPDKHKNLFPAGESKLQRSIRYTDYSLGEFFNEIKNMPWYKHTLFIITADHTARDEQTNDDNSVKMYRIPIVFYHPGDSSLKGRSAKIVQQTDIMPSVYQYLGINSPFLAFGQSVFAHDSTWAVYYLGGIYKFITGNYVLSFDGEKSLFLEDISINAKQNINLLATQSNMALKMEAQLKAIIQQYYTRLTQNRMVSKLAK